MPRKPDPEKYCEYCGAKLERKRQRNGSLESLLHFGRRKYCDRKCMAAAFDAKPSQSTDWETTHWHARKLVPPGPCTECGKPDASDVHHLDGDHTNNTPSNLARLCRSCHLKAHRMKGACVVCGKPVKGHGYCEMHYQRWKKWGDPLMVKVNQHTKAQRLTD